MQHVGASGVRPIHVSPNRCLRVVLMEHVIASAKINGTVGIVHPVVCGQKMILRAKGIGSQFAAKCLSCGVIGDAKNASGRGGRNCRGSLQESSPREWHDRSASPDVWPM